MNPSTWNGYPHAAQNSSARHRQRHRCREEKGIALKTVLCTELVEPTNLYLVISVRTKPCTPLTPLAYTFYSWRGFWGAPLEVRPIADSCVGWSGLRLLLAQSEAVLAGLELSLALLKSRFRICGTSASEDDSSRP